MRKLSPLGRTGLKIPLILLSTAIAIPAVAQQNASTTAPKQALTSARTSVPGTIRPSVMRLIDEATAVYSKMSSYQHTAEVIQRNAQNAIESDHAYTLAIERPNKFVYKSDDASQGAAVCDGSYYVNYSGTDHTYTRSAAPPSLNDIDIVNGVNFDAVGTYLVALMIQNRPLADPQIRNAFEHAGAVVMETDNGVQYQTLTASLVPDAPPAVIYFNAKTHLIHKVVIRETNVKESTIEVLEDIHINQPIANTVFQFTPPKDAHWVI